jgi:hypothetical protein
MAPDPQCTAVAAAKDKSGLYSKIVDRVVPTDTLLFSGLSYGQIAQRIGKSEQHVIDSEFPGNSADQDLIAVQSALANRSQPLQSSTPWPRHWISNRVYGARFGIK